MRPLSYSFAPKNLRFNELTTDQHKSTRIPRLGGKLTSNSLCFLCGLCVSVLSSNDSLDRLDFPKGFEFESKWDALNAK